MKILKSDYQRSDFLKKEGQSARRPSRRKSQTSDFMKVLNKTLSEQGEDWEEFQVLLPQHGHFWDNGYEDKEEVYVRAN